MNENQDEEIVKYVRKMYGRRMAAHVEGILASDPLGETGFVRSVRGSLLREAGLLAGVREGNE